MHNRRTILAALTTLETEGRKSLDTVLLSAHREVKLKIDHLPELEINFYLCLSKIYMVKTTIKEHDNKQKLYFLKNISVFLASEILGLFLVKA
jgi:hypothetical protein